MARAAVGVALGVVAAAWTLFALLPQIIGQDGGDLTACVAPGSGGDLLQKALCLGGIVALFLGWRYRNVLIGLAAIVPLALWIPLGTC